ncbi:hypothetical protein ABL78_3997 [Leptomonas seymouri]|uniref:Uncharacterized protein n=1 Tax=Leptomonas seymouri TaxID=5684 RepID=A0A0N1PDA4_LEPSE|nr:hypothetical protein ABL78_3997 [Leptomonas seymouri]|eukprot:KPI86951.1 hypothetical protein ABL78_3997 [Leptomonas seymouri]
MPYITIPEALTGLTSRKCKMLGKKYGVSGAEVWTRARSGNDADRTFSIIHLVPHVISEEELMLDSKEFKRILLERGVGISRGFQYRAKVLQRRAGGGRETRDSNAEPNEAPAAPPCPANSSALPRLYDTRTDACFGLHLLVMVQSEDAAMPHGASVRAQLRRLPMPVLQNFIAELWQVRSAWERELLAPCAAALAEEQAHTEEEKTNALLYHVCLWQRRYPLALLLSVLAFHSKHRIVFTPATPADRCETQRLEWLLEELQRMQYPDLSDVPGLIRCDVLMGYPQMPPEEQAKLMRRVTAVCQRRAGASDGKAKGEDDQAALRRHSRTAPDPQLLLAEFAPPGTRIPPRFCSGMSMDAYLQMRAAFERHKQDGVRRLARQDYGGESLSSAREAGTPLTPRAQ